MVKNMSQQTNKKFILKISRDKRGVSEMIGYVLLISLAVFMGGALFVWMKSYIPSEKLDCPDDTALSVTQYTYDCAGTPNRIDISLKNNGKFSIGGYFIKASYNENASVATTDLSQFYVNNQSSFVPTYNNAVLFGDIGKNGLEPGDGITNIYSLGGTTQIKFIEIIPMRWQKEDNNLRLVSCSDKSQIKEIIKCTS